VPDYFYRLIGDFWNSVQQSKRPFRRDRRSFDTFSKTNSESKEKGKHAFPKFANSQN
jgi:hypothetical protein